MKFRLKSINRFLFIFGLELAVRLNGDGHELWLRGRSKAERRGAEVRSA